MYYIILNINNIINMSINMSINIVQSDAILFNFDLIKHSQFIWNVKTNLKIIEPFDKTLNINNLSVSFDNESFYFPSEITNNIVISYIMDNFDNNLINFTNTKCLIKTFDLCNCYTPKYLTSDNIIYKQINVWKNLKILNHYQQKPKLFQFPYIYYNQLSNVIRIKHPQIIDPWMFYFI